MSLPADLIAAYRAAIYRVSAPGGSDIDLKIGQANPDLDKWLSSLACDVAHVITAWNPHSQNCSLAFNQSANTQMQEDLMSRRTPYLATIHIDPLGQWPNEHGFCVAGLGRAQALRLASDFRQNAILEHQQGHKTELLLTKP